MKSYPISIFLGVVVSFSWTNASETIHHLRQVDDRQNVQSNQVANNIVEVNRMEMVSSTQMSSDCANVCNNNRVRTLSFINPNDEQNNFVELLMKGIRGFMNRLFGITRQNAIHGIPTKMILPYFTNHSSAMKSLTQKLRKESGSTAALFDAPNVILMMYNFSADNIESLSEVLDPIIDNLSQQETIDIGTIGCDLIRLLTFINNKTLPNIVSMVEVISTMSNNTEIMKNYSKFSTTWSKRSTPTSDVTFTQNNDGAILQCMKGAASSSEAFPNTLTSALAQPKLISPTSNLRQNDDNGGPLVLIAIIIGSIVLYPLSIVVSIVASIIAVILLIGLIIYDIVFYIVNNNNNRQLQPVDGGPWAPIIQELFSPPYVYVVILLGLIASPIILPVLTLSAILELIVYFFGLTMNSSASDTSKDVLYKLTILLESPFESMMSSMQKMYNFHETLSLDDKVDLECQIDILMCKNTALLNALPID